MKIEIFRQGSLLSTLWDKNELDFFLAEEVEHGDVLREDDDSTFEVMEALKSWCVNYEIVGNRFRIVRNYV